MVLKSMRFVKEISFCSLYSIALVMNFIVIWHWVSKLILGKFESYIGFDKCAGLFLALFFALLFIYENFSLVDNGKLNNKLHLIIIIISMICSMIYGFTLEYYTPQKFCFDKNDEIFQELLWTGWLSILPVALTSVSKTKNFGK